MSRSPDGIGGRTGTTGLDASTLPGAGEAALRARGLCRARIRRCSLAPNEAARGARRRATRTGAPSKSRRDKRGDGDSGQSGNRLDRALDRALYVACAALLMLIAATVITAVTLRYVFNEPPLWAEEMPRLFLAWMTFLGIALATRRGENIRVDHYVTKLPPRLRLAVEMVMHLLVLAFLLVAIRWSWPVFRLQMNTHALSTGITHAWNYAALPVGCTLALVYQTRLMIRTWRGLPRRDEIAEEDAGAPAGSDRL